MKKLGAIVGTLLMTLGLLTMSSASASAPDPTLPDVRKETAPGKLAQLTPCVSSAGGHQLGTYCEYNDALIRWQAGCRNLHVFAVARNGAVYNSLRNCDGVWSEWRLLGRVEVPFSGIAAAAYQDKLLISY